ncbi:MAG TPA: hypothetical protein VLH79_08250 [Chthonomonadales bacterium]|nr:hypothetical protein [Chthonomonadales bacterium]
MAWPTHLATEPGEIVTWLVRPAASDGPRAGGAWWIVEPSEVARFRAACTAVQASEDRVWRGVGMALAAAECGLYEESLALLDELLRNPMSRGQEAITRRARLSVLTGVARTAPEAVQSLAGEWLRSEVDGEERALALCLCPAARRAETDGASLRARVGATSRRRAGAARVVMSAPVTGL